MAETLDTQGKSTHRASPWALGLLGGAAEAVVSAAEYSDGKPVAAALTVAVAGMTMAVSLRYECKRTHDVPAVVEPEVPSLPHRWFEGIGWIPVYFLPDPTERQPNP